eukprot:CAMPEP_0197079606 /NCGR_PEP_ID=MMETSP1384-20130603/213709_1 /TAXON_ID=29189 /ORGANISM="Ammonia sp." /LENGTH=516 /DNA_ID=CAMNT_0042518483 /DNA_START=18 /DNA_END=1566 /DNA_ORIENTATION=+
MAFWKKPGNVNRQHSDSELYGVGNVEPQFETPGDTPGLTPLGDDEEDNVDSKEPQWQQPGSPIVAAQHSVVITNGGDFGEMEEGTETAPENAKTAVAYVANGTDDDAKATEAVSSNEDAYQMCEGIECAAQMRVIEVQPEGQMMSSRSCNSTLKGSFIPNNHGQELKVDEMAQKINDSVGMFKCRDIGKTAFTEVVLATTRQQRLALGNHYESRYGMTLQKVIEKYFRGAIRELLIFLVMSENEFTVRWIELAIKKKDVNLLTFIICTQMPQRLDEIRNLYNSQNKKTMKSKINGLTSNIFHKRNINKFLMDVLDGKRPLCDEPIDMNQVAKIARNINKFLMDVLDGKRPLCDEPIDMNQVAKDCKDLWDGSQSKESLKKGVYREIFTQRSFQHIYCVAEKFRDDHGTSLFDTVSKVWKESSETGYAIGVILNFSTRRVDLFAETLSEAVREPGPNFVMLFRVIVERCETDLADIIQRYGYIALKNWIKYDVQPKEPDIAKILNKLLDFRVVFRVS